MSDGRPATLDLYGTRLLLPFDPEPVLARRPPAPSRTAVTFEPTTPDPIGSPTWESGDEQRIRIERRPGSIRIDVGDDGFDIGPGLVGYRCNDPAEALDRNHNVLMALILPFVEMIALHACVIDLPTGRVAILGESGAGKTTLGGGLSARGGRLVSDDLLALDTAGLAHDGPPFRRLVAPEPGAERDAGGKFRVAVDPEPRPPAPVDLFVVLDGGFDRPVRFGGADALDPVLARPYCPVTATAWESVLRLDILGDAVGRSTVVGLPPRWRRPPAQADLVAGLASEIGDRRRAAGSPLRSIDGGAASSTRGS